MIHTLAITNDFKINKDININDLKNNNIKWYWVDFDDPSVDESLLLDTFFDFHPLAIEDCLHFLQRPKVDKYDEYNFFVIHKLNQIELTPEEVDLFVGSNFIVSFHRSPVKEIEDVWEKIMNSPQQWREGTIFVEYSILDKLVDNYFPPVYEITDYINELDEIQMNRQTSHFMDKVFDTRGRLLKLRRIVNQMKDLLYRILDAQHSAEYKNRHVYFTDIYDHLIRLSELIESSLLVTSDLRDSYISMNSDRMNRTMMLFTAITTIFVPVTFIAGVYGMNFQYMPELALKYGYFITLGIMIFLVIAMFIWFKKKGWFDI